VCGHTAVTHQCLVTTEVDNRIINCRVMNNTRYSNHQMPITYKQHALSTNRPPTDSVTLCQLSSHAEFVLAQATLSQQTWQLLASRYLEL